MAQKKVAAVDIDLKRTSGLPPIGMYRLVVAKTDLKDGPAAPYIAMECVVDNTKPAGEKVWNGRTVFTNLSLAPQARWKMEEALDSIGAPEEGTIDDIGWFIGKRFYAWLSHHEWEGRKRLQVEEFIPQDEVADRFKTWLGILKDRKAEEEKSKKARAKMAKETVPEATDEELEELEELAGDEEPDGLDDILDDLWLDDEDEEE